MKNALNWFEIPVTDFARAVKFYETILDMKIGEMPFPDGKYGIMAYDQEGVGGGLVQSEGMDPSAKGTIVYLNAVTDVNDPLSKVEAAGGKIIFPKTSIGVNGFMAHIIDTEGNRVGLHSMM
ncbi:MAG: VOC family protein [Cytophagaceae bacterium]